MGDLLNVDMNYLIGKKESTEISLRESGIQGPLQCLTESEAGGHSVCKRDDRDRGAQKKWESL